MPDDYTAFSEKLGEIEVTVKETEHACVELPLPIAKELCYGVFSYISADEELFNGNEELASKALQRAVAHVSQASFYALKFRFLFYSKFARSVIAELEEHKKLAFQSILNYDEQSENFPEIINLIETAKLPSETSPKSQATCKENIEKIQAFLSNFKTEKGELFPMIDVESRAGVREGVNSYDELKRKLFKNFNEAKTRIKRFECYNVEFPLPVARDLYYGITSYIKADKKLFSGNEEGAVTVMKEAFYRSRWAFFDTTKLSILGYLRDACDTWKLLIKHKQVTERLVPGYRKHAKNLSAIGEIIENKTFPDEEPEEKQAVSCEDKLREFLDEFQKVRSRFFEEIKWEQMVRTEAIKKTPKRGKEAKNKGQYVVGKGFLGKIAEKVWDVIVTIVLTRFQG